MADEEYIEELKRQGVPKGHSRYAVEYLEAAGIDPRTVDVAAEYDSTLTDTENNHAFAQKYPTGQARRHSKAEIDSIDEQADEFAEKAYFEDRRRDGYNPSYNQLPGSKLNDEYAPGKSKHKKSMQSFDEGDLPGEPEKKGNIIDDLKGRYARYKSEGQRRAEVQRHERVHQANEKSRKLEEDLELKRAEARTRELQRVKDRYEHEERATRIAPLVAAYSAVHGHTSVIREMLSGRRGDNQQLRMLTGQFGGRNHRYGGRESGFGDNHIMRLLSGEREQSRRRPSYGQPSYDQYGQSRREPSMLERLSLGGSGNSMGHRLFGRGHQDDHADSRIGHMAMVDRESYGNRRTAHGMQAAPTSRIGGIARASRGGHGKLSRLLFGGK